MRFSAPNIAKVRLISLILTIFISSEIFPQSWIEYNISTGIQTTIPYTLISSGSSAYSNGNQGILPANYSSDTGRAFFPLDIVNDANAYPWRVTVKIGDATGILIDPYHVLTAGHILDFSPGFINTIITPAYNQGNSPYGFARPEKLYLLSNFVQSSATDLGIIKLDRPLGALTGWCGLGYNNTDSYFTTNLFFNPSYPLSGVYNGELLYNWKGKFDACYADFLYSYRQGVTGMSGSGVYTKVNDNFVSYGILLASGIKINRITASKYDAVNQILNNNTKENFDAIPLLTNVYPKILTSGNQLDSISFIILNYSSENKNNANLSANLYLSDDSVITSSDILLGSYSVTQSFPSKSSATIRINSGLPTINKPSGNYWLGVILSGDSDTSNNASSGYDAARIIVNNTGNVRISGTIVSSQSNNGISGVVMNGFPLSVITDYSGYYETEVPAGWGGTITPSKPGFSLNPANKSYNNLNINATDNYIAAKNIFLVSGCVKSPVQQKGVSNAKIFGFIGEPVTDTSGNYSATVYQGWSGYLTIQKSGWYISPGSLSYSNINSNINQQITAGFLVKGLVTKSNGNPIKNVAMNGFPGSTIYSDSTGVYSKFLDSGWCGTVIPVYPGILFNPPGRTYTNLSTSYYYHDYSEIPVTALNLRVFLSGPYVSGTDTMNCSLMRNSKLPQLPNRYYSGKGSLFYQNLKSSDTVSQSFWSQNKKIVDWVSVEIVNTSDFSPVDTVFGLLRNDGRILSLYGDTLIKLSQDIPSGNYYVIIRHRNHIAVMTKLPVYLSNNTQLYDFTTGPDKYYGEDAKLLKAGFYGMYAGDVNFDGVVNNMDFIIYNNDSQNSVFGYVISDINLDGYVTSKDFNFIAPNIKKNVSTNIPAINMAKR